MYRLFGLFLSFIFPNRKEIISSWTLAPCSNLHFYTAPQTHIPYLESYVILFVIFLEYKFGFYIKNMYLFLFSQPPIVKYLVYDCFSLINITMTNNLVANGCIHSLLSTETNLPDFKFLNKRSYIFLCLLITHCSISFQRVCTNDQQIRCLVIYLNHHPPKGSSKIFAILYSKHNLLLYYSLMLYKYDWTYLHLMVGQLHLFCQ